MKKFNEKEYPSIHEEETREFFDLLLPATLPGRQVIVSMLTGHTTKPISSILVKPITGLPAMITENCDFVQTDRHNFSNYLAYGTGVDGKEKLLYNDSSVSRATHNDHSSVDIELIRRTFTYEKPFVIVTIEPDYEGSNSLVVYCYIK